MEKYEIWKILGIAETKDTDAIRQVYHEKLRSVNPEDDQVGFMRLREAYENALSYAGQTNSFLPCIGFWHRKSAYGRNAGWERSCRSLRRRWGSGARCFY